MGIEIVGDVHLWGLQAYSHARVHLCDYESDELWGVQHKNQHETSIFFAFCFCFLKIFKIFIGVCVCENMCDYIYVYTSTIGGQKGESDPLELEL